MSKSSDNIDNIVSMKISSKYFDAIVDGTKTIEGRLYDEKRQQMFNDCITTVKFVCEDGRTIIKDIVIYHLYDLLQPPKIIGKK